MLPLKARCEILYSYYMDWAENSDYNRFIEVNDVGLPCACLFVVGKITLTDSGIESVNDTWNDFCLVLNIDPDSDYRDLDEMMLDFLDSE